MPRDKRIIEDAEEDFGDVDAIEKRREEETQRLDKHYQQKQRDSENVEQMLKLSQKKGKEDQEFSKIRSGNKITADLKQHCKR